jgi:hypothetical protein
LGLRAIVTKFTEHRFVSVSCFTVVQNVSEISHDLGPDWFSNRPQSVFISKRDFPPGGNVLHPEKFENHL